MQTMSTWHQRPCTRTSQSPWIWTVRYFCRSHLQQMLISKLLDSVYTKNHIDDGMIGCRLSSIWHEGTSNFLHSWLQPGHTLFVQPLVCRWNNFPRECMAMWQCGVPLSKCSFLAHAHGWLTDTSGCDEGLPKERIINKRGLRPFLISDSLQHSSNSAWLGCLVGILCPLSLTLIIIVVFSTQIHNIVCISSNCHQVVFFRCIHCCQQGLLVTFHLGAYCGLYCQKMGSIRDTRCWLSLCTRSDNPFPASCCFRNVGVYVTFDVRCLPSIPQKTHSG